MRIIPLSTMLAVLTASAMAATAFPYMSPSAGNRGEDRQEAPGPKHRQERVTRGLGGLAQGVDHLTQRGSHHEPQHAQQRDEQHEQDQVQRRPRLACLTDR